jgi:UDP-N-acetylmuramoylalanine--D-glutamate ligase
MGLAQLKMTDTMAQGKTVIVGLGKTGLSCARFLARQGADVMVVDSRAEPPGKNELQQELPEVMTQFGPFDAALLQQAELLVVSPGVSLREPAIAVAIEAGVEVIGDIELFARHVNAPVIAITGSNGKSTVTMMVGEMARAAKRNVCVGGNIGTPALELLQDDAELYVLELSSFQLETTTSLKPVAAVVLNVSQDHLDRYHDMDEYAVAKERIYHGAEHRIINLDDPVVATWGGEDALCLRFTLNQPEGENDYGLRWAQGETWLAKGEALLMPVAELKIAGMHNVANTLAAIALGDSAGLPMAAMLDALRNFTGLPHRCQWIGEQAGVTWYNDSKATNVGAAGAAINGMSGKVVLLAGGEGKGQDFTPLRNAMANKGRAAVLFGRDADQIEQALNNVVPVKRVTTLIDAVKTARTLAQAGDAVLLAPACASFDMFKGYDDRGNQFAAAVREVLA